MNPLAQPATILNGGKAAQAFTGLVDKVNLDLEQKRMREELKKQGIADELLPLDVDMKDAYMYEIDEITKGINDYSNQKADLATQGIDITQPEYKRQWNQAETYLTGQALKSKQHQKIDFNALETLSKAGADAIYDVEASKQKLADFRAAASQGVDKAQEFLMNNGSLLVEKPFDVYKYSQGVADMYKPKTVEGDPQRKGGLYISETVTDLTPQSYLTAGENWLHNPKARMTAEYEYSNLSPQTQAKYEQKAIEAGGQAGDGIKMYAGDIKIKPYIEQKKDLTITKPNTGGSGSKTKEKTPQSNLLVDGIVGALELNPNYVKKNPFGYLEIDQFTGQQIGNYSRPVKVPKYNEKGEAVVKDGVQQFENDPNGAVEQVPEFMEVALYSPEDKSWYVRTNRTAEGKMGNSFGGESLMVKYSPKEFKNLMYRIATASGEWTNSEIDEYLSEKGLVAADGSFNVQEGSKNTQGETKAVSFGGTTYRVPLENMNAEKTEAKLADGKVVHWDGSKWVAGALPAGSKSTKTTKKDWSKYEEPE